MTVNLVQYRRFFAEELEAVAKLKTPGQVDAFAAVPREQFLGPGPWAVLADSDLTGAASPTTRLTADADPRRVYHNIAVAIDPSRQLFNGQPGTLGVWVDALGLGPGKRVLHVGAGLGYYTAVMAHTVGPSGRVVAFEVDDELAARARQNLASLPWVEMRHADATERLDDAFDAVLINVGVTHPQESWLDALAPGGRMVVPLTSTMIPMGATIGKGLVFVVSKSEAASDLDARVLTVVAIYSAVGLRDDGLNARLGRAMMGGPVQWASVKRLRRDPHDATASCWLHGDRFCLSTA